MGLYCYHDDIFSVFILDDLRKVIHILFKRRRSVRLSCFLSDLLVDEEAEEDGVDEGVIDLQDEESNSEGNDEADEDDEPPVVHLDYFSVDADEIRADDDGTDEGRQCSNTHNPNQDDEEADACEHSGTNNITEEKLDSHNR